LARKKNTLLKELSVRSCVPIELSARGTSKIKGAVMADEVETLSDETVASVSESQSKEEKPVKKSKPKEKKKDVKKKEKKAAKKEKKAAKKAKKKEKKAAKKDKPKKVEKKKDKPKKEKAKPVKKKPGVVQHRNRDSKYPFREASILGRAFAMSIKGTSIKELTKFCEKESSNIAWLLRALRRRERFDWTWNYTEEKGKFRIYNLKKPK